MSFQYSIHRVPSSPTDTATTPPTLLPYLAGKFSALRLSALLDSPSSFASTFELESLYSSSVWLSRFSRPKFHYFLAVAHSPSSPPETHTIGTGLLVGSVQLYGPSLASFFTLPLGGAPPPEPDAQELKYQMIALYSSSLHRRKGLAKLLIQGAIESARKQAQREGKEKVRIRVFLHPENLIVKTLYGSLGFVETGLCTLAEAVVQNGDPETLPEDGGKGNPERWLNMLGIVMEWVG
ncbi:putative gnat family protein [Botrytis fragariae]|uniref:Putative gnat family protein n=1 Tax=Botrytis fragariae TaxID=1964551 RepID=A0A8H6EGB5_9HELO|nr:putative gnat family protein [Botrytis fragariae]KAF5870885.1 putative gnat family protein [Botrytis fragariae]